MILRHLTPVLKARFAAARSVLLTGARQTGKTTLARQTFPRLPYSSLENPEDRSFAQEDPKAFLAQFPGGAVLDEIHRVPSLLSTLQGIIDEGERKFILTGSQNILLLEKVSQSLAGRLALLTLRPLTERELSGRPVYDPAKHLFAHPGKAPLGGRPLMDRIVQGGYPEPVTKPKTLSFWFGDYIRTYVERDVRMILNVKDTLAFQRFLALCAGRSGQLLNMASLANDVGISPGTVGHWLSVLQAGGLVYLLPPYHENFNKRVIKSPKLYFLDTGLLCRLIGIRHSRELKFHPLVGAIFETYVVSEIRKNLLNLGREPELFFWRDQHGVEVDLLLLRGAKRVPLEIKLGQTVSGDLFKGLRRWKELSGDKTLPACLLYGGESEYEREGVTIKSYRSL